MKKVPFATISFKDKKYEDVFLVQVFRPRGAVIECTLCEMDVDEIIDAPILHQEKCTNRVTKVVVGK